MIWVIMLGFGQDFGSWLKKVKSHCYSVLAMIDRSDMGRLFVPINQSTYFYLRKKKKKNT